MIRKAGRDPVAVLVVAIATAACMSSTGGEAAGTGCMAGTETCACTPTGACNAPLTCLSGLCVKAPGAADGAAAGDTGQLDTGQLDIGTADAGAADVGKSDTAPVDTGPVDAGPPDTGPPDTGPPDAGPPDTGPPDTGPIDTGYDPVVACPFKSYKGGVSKLGVGKGEEGAAAGLLPPAVFGSKGGMLSWAGMPCAVKAGTSTPSSWKLCGQVYDCGGCKVDLRRHKDDFPRYSVIIDKDAAKPACKWGIYQMFDKAEYEDLKQCKASAAVKCTCVKKDYILAYHDALTVMLPIGSCTLDKVQFYTVKQCMRRYKCKFGGKDLNCKVTLTREGFGATAKWRFSAYGSQCITKDATPLSSGPMVPSKCPDTSGLTKCADCAKACKGIPGCVCTKRYH